MCMSRSWWPTFPPARPACWHTNISYATQASTLSRGTGSSCFRACAAGDQSLRWDVKHGDLRLECFARSAREPGQQPSKNTSGRRPCTYCGGLFHFPDNCPSHPFRGSRRHGASLPPKPYQLSPSSSSTPQPIAGRTHPPPPPADTQFICRDFNSSRGCKRYSCKFPHVCTRCGNPSHGVWACSRPPSHPPSH